MRGTLTTLVGTIICLGALAVWYHLTPADGSGWALFVAFIGSLGLLDSDRKPALVALAGVFLTVACAAAWYFHSQFYGAGWVGFLAIIAALDTLSALSSMDKKSKK